MDGHVQKDPPRSPDVVLGRRGRISAGDSQDMRHADLAGFNGLMHLQKVQIESPVESHHQADSGLFHGFVDRRDSLEGQLGWLFAEDLLAPRGRVQNHLGMSVRGGTNDHRLDIRQIQHLPVIQERLRNPELRCHRGKFFGNDIRQSHNLGPRDPVHQVFDVDLSNSTYSQHTKSNFPFAHCSWLLSALARSVARA